MSRNPYIRRESMEMQKYGAAIFISGGMGGGQGARGMKILALILEGHENV